MSLFSIAERFTSLDRSALTLNEERCLHSQDRFAGCQACFAICPTNAITPGKPPRLNPEKCAKCMVCLMVCPVGAYSADGSVVSLMNAVKNLQDRPVEILCEINPHAAQGISKESSGICIKGCLAGLGSGAYFSLAAFRNGQILVRTDACSGCVWATLPGQVEAQVRQAQQVLEVWGKAANLTSISHLDTPLERPLWEGTNPPLSRRDLFTSAFRQGRETLARAVDDLGTVSERLPGRDRLRLSNAVKHMPAPQPGHTGSLKGLDFGLVSVSQDCTACGICARICPTSALQFVKDGPETAFNLTFSARNCVGCEMCLHVCAPNAISLEHDPAFAQVFNQETVSVYAGALMKCKKCGAATVAKPGVDLCPLCEFRRTHPLGSMLPPGIKNIKPPAAREKTK